MRKLICIYILFIIPCYADFNQGLKAYREAYGNHGSKKYLDALKEWLPIAEKGDPKMQLYVGILYYENLTFSDIGLTGYPTDDKNYQTTLKGYEKGLEWFKISANNGNAEAGLYLGYAYSENILFDADYKEALSWIKKSVSNGSIEAKVWLGNFYERGSWVTRNKKEAKRLYKEAFDYWCPLAEKEDRIALEHIGLMYLNDEGQKKDYNKAYKYFLSSAKKGSKRGITAIAKMYLYGKGQKKNIHKANKLFELVSNSKYQDASWILSNIYNGVYKNIQPLKDGNPKKIKAYNLATGRAETVHPFPIEIIELNEYCIKDSQIEEEVCRIIEEGENIQNELKEAFYNDDQKFIELLLDYGESINQKKYNNTSYLHIMAEWGKYNIAKALIEKKAYLNDRDNNEYTPLLTAIYNSNTKIAKLLINNGADVNAEGDMNYGKQVKTTPLLLSVYDFELVKILIQHGAKINVENIKGETPLDRAVQYGSPECVEYLIKNGADVNAEGKYTGCTPLLFACSRNELKIAKILIDHGACVFRKDSMNRTPLETCNFQQNELADLIKKTEISQTEEILKAPDVSLKLILQNLKDPNCDKNQVPNYLWALAKIKDPIAVDAIIKIAEETSLSNIDEMALQALTEIGTEDCAEYIFNRLQNYKKLTSSVLEKKDIKHQRFHMINYLSKMKYKPIIPFLQEMLDYNYSLAVLCFGKFGKDAIPELIKNLHNINKNIRLNTVCILNWLVVDEAKDALKKQFFVESDDEIKKEILTTLNTMFYNEKEMTSFYDEIIKNFKVFPFGNLEQFQKSFYELQKNANELKIRKKDDRMIFKKECNQFKNSMGKGGDYSILEEYSDQEKDEQSLIDIREVILRENSDEAIRTCKRINDIIRLNRIIKLKFT